MTNGEKLKEIFPYLESDDTDLVKVLNIDNLKSWWNAEYKEPTTKNNLGADCVSRQEVDRLACRYLKEPTDNHVAFYEHFLDLSSVTPQERKGHWIKIKPYPLQMHEYECSECGHETDDNTECYCSDCGARMIESQKSEDKK